VQPIWVVEQSCNRHVYWNTISSCHFIVLHCCFLSPVCCDTSSYSVFGMTDTIKDDCCVSILSRTYKNGIISIIMIAVQPMPVQSWGVSPYRLIQKSTLGTPRNKCIKRVGPRIVKTISLFLDSESILQSRPRIKNGSGIPIHFLQRSGSNPTRKKGKKDPRIWA
jgi:hypothetical protein